MAGQTGQLAAYSAITTRTSSGSPDLHPLRLSWLRLAVRPKNASRHPPADGLKMDASLTEARRQFDSHRISSVQRPIKLNVHLDKGEAEAVIHRSFLEQPADLLYGHVRRFV